MLRHDFAHVASDHRALPHTDAKRSQNRAGPSSEGNAVTKLACAIIIGLTIAWTGSSPASAQGAVVVPAKAGAVDGTTQNSDAFIWRLFTEFAAPAFKSRPSPVVFETWASDEDTFSTKPQWPGPDAPRKLHACVPESEPATSAHRSGIDVACGPPKNPAVGGFPTSGTPTPCIAEENKQNYDQFQYTRIQ
jgi:hypothetical protein